MLLEYSEVIAVNVKFVKCEIFLILESRVLNVLGIDDFVNSLLRDFVLIIGFYLKTSLNKQTILMILLSLNERQSKHISNI